MTAQQTSVTATMATAFAGMLADSNDMKRASSKVSEEASAEIPFGVMLCRGTDKDNGALLLNTSAAAMASAMVGVVVHDHAYAKDVELGDTGLKPKVSLNVLTHGRIYVQPEETVHPGDAVRVRAVATGDEVFGTFRTTADAADTVNITSFARWVTSGTSSTPAVLELDMTYALGVADS